MTYPEEYTERLYRLKYTGLGTAPKRLVEVLKSDPELYVDVIYEKMTAICVIVFPTKEDHTAFTLKYGKNYV